MRVFPLLQQQSGVRLQIRGKGIISRTGQNQDGSAVWSDGCFLLEHRLKIIQLLLVEWLFGRKNGTRLSVIAGAECEDLRAVRGGRPEDGFSGWVLARINHCLKTKSGGNLRHLLVNAACINVPAVFGFDADHLFVPPETFDSQADEGFAAG